MAEGWCDLAANPMHHEAVRRLVPEGVPQWGPHCQPHLTRAQIERLVTCSQVPAWRRVHHLFAATSGLAQGEIFGLAWRDMDLENGVVRINKALALKSKSGRVGLQNPKTSNRMRELPVHSLAVKALKAWKARGFAEFAERVPLDSDPVFPSPRRNKHREIMRWRPNMSEFLREDLRISGQPDSYEGWPLTAHALRRTFATWLAEAEVPELSRRRLMGHAAANVTDGSYTSKSVAMLREAVEKIKLDLSAGEVIDFPMRLAVRSHNLKTTGHAGETDPKFARSKPAANRPGASIIETPIFLVTSPRIDRAANGFRNRLFP
jgi:integrase